MFFFSFFLYPRGCMLCDQEQMMAENSRETVLPAAVETKFDSNTLKRMLQTLPEFNPKKHMEKPEENPTVSETLYHTSNENTTNGGARFNSNYFDTTAKNAENSNTNETNQSSSVMSGNIAISSSAVPVQQLRTVSSMSRVDDKGPGSTRGNGLPAAADTVVTSSLTSSLTSSQVSGGAHAPRVEFDTRVVLPPGAELGSGALQGLHAAVSDVCAPFNSCLFTATSIVCINMFHSSFN